MTISPFIPLTFGIIAAALFITVFAGVAILARRNRRIIRNAYRGSIQEPINYKAYN